MTVIEETFNADKIVKDQQDMENIKTQSNISESDSDISFESDDGEVDWKPGPSTEISFTVRHRKTGEEILFLGLLGT